MKRGSLGCAGASFASLSGSRLGSKSFVGRISFHSSVAVRKDQKQRTIDPEIENHWLNQWEQPEYNEEFYYPPRHPEIRRAYTELDGIHASLLPFNFYTFGDMTEERFQEELDSGESLYPLLKRTYKEGTVNPLDEPDPDDPVDLIIPEGCHIKDFKFPSESSSFKEVGPGTVLPEEEDWK